MSIALFIFLSQESSGTGRVGPANWRTCRFRISVNDTEGTAIDTYSVVNVYLR
jgi:hypothetical protein